MTSEQTAMEIVPENKYGRVIKASETLLASIKQFIAETDIGVHRELVGRNDVHPRNITESIQMFINSALYFGTCEKDDDYVVMKTITERLLMTARNYGILKLRMGKWKS